LLWARASATAPSSTPSAREAWGSVSSSPDGRILVQIPAPDEATALPPGKAPIVVVQNWAPTLKTGTQ
jgi:hypothetical protein